MYLVISLLGHLAAETLRFATLIPSYTQIWRLTGRIFVFFCLDLQSRHAIGAMNVWAAGVRISIGGDFKSSNRGGKIKTHYAFNCFSLGVFWVGGLYFWNFGGCVGFVKVLQFPPAVQKYAK